jgi:molybdopterin molybdotransferase
VLAEPVFADRDQPPFPRSTRDGFACRAEDLHSPLRIIGQIRAGQSTSGHTIHPGEAVEIMTGAAVPPGADCVVMVEHVIADTASESIRLMDGRELHSGDNIVPAAAEARAGSEIISVGTRLGPAHIAAAAACGYASVRLFPRPRVAVLATGDELVEIAERPRPEQIRNSNSYSLAAQILACGAEPVILPIVRDDLAATERAIENALDCDLILLSGGVSMGKYDFVEQALLALHAEFFFTGAKIQPGRPIVFGRLPYKDGTRFFFGLPGNPISTMVTFALFAAPVIAQLAGEEGSSGPKFAVARLASEVRVKPGLTRFLPAHSESSISGTQVWPLSWQGSGDLSSAASANCYLVVPEDIDAIKTGDTVTTLLL